MTGKEVQSEFLQRLDELYGMRHLDQEATARYNLYQVDLSGWKLRLSNQTPLIWVGAEEAESLYIRELAESLQDMARTQGWRHQNCIILLDKDGGELKRHLANQYFPCFVIVDVADQRKILAASSFTGALLDLVCDQIPISNLAPYQTSSPVEGSRFFGREHEIGRILAQHDLNFAIMGIRRIGKTSLLREIRWRLLTQGENPARIVWLDCSTISTPDIFVQEIVRRLHIRELDRMARHKMRWFLLPDFLRRMFKMHDGRITILLDEADWILTWARDDQGVLSTLRASVAAGHCRYVVTGFQNLMGEFSDQKSPLYMAFEPLRLGPFEKEDTEDVILRPMRALRVKFKNAGELVTRVHEDTRGHPLLVQFYCRKLIEQLERRTDRTLGPDSLGDIYIGDDFKALIVNTFRDNVSVQDKALVYALLNYFPEDKETFTQDEMYRALLRKGCSFQPEEIDRVCERLVLAGIFVRKGPRHQFAHPIFPRILRANYNLEHLLSAAKKEIGL